MSLVISVLIIVLAAAFVAAPLFGPAPSEERAPATPAVPTERPQLERQKLDAYAAIKEAEFDYRMGKLSEADFTTLRERYAAQALEAIAAVESAQAAQSRQAAMARRPIRIAFCPRCGHTVPPRANFCPACGRSLKEEVA